MRRMFDTSNVTVVTIYKDAFATANICFVYYVKDTLQTALDETPKHRSVIWTFYP